MIINIKIKTIALAAIIVTLAACQSPIESDPPLSGQTPSSNEPDTAEPVETIEFCGENGTPVMRVPYSSRPIAVHFSNLRDNTIYLMKVNISDSFVYAANAGSIRPSIQDLYSAGNEMPRIGHPAAAELMANPIPPHIVNEAPRMRAAFVSWVVGSEKNFYVESAYNSNTYAMKTATLISTGRYCNIWAVNSNYSNSATSVDRPNNTITAVQADILAAKFDAMYPAATNILGGFPFGHGPDEDGGRDHDPKFQVLVCDIGSNVAGYFFTADWYPRSVIPYSNESEMIYLDARLVNTDPDFMGSALAHELQHAVHWNMKYVKNGKISATWFQELCSLMLEDILAPYVGIYTSNSYHVSRYRIPEFLEHNNPYITDYTLSGVSYFSYGNTYAYGAMLLRWFGPGILNRIVTNDLTDFDSVSKALDGFYSGLTFEESLMRMGEAMIFSGPKMPEGVMTFDRTKTCIIENISYTVTGFDIWRDFSRKGPAISDLDPKSMAPYSLRPHSTDAWKNKSGDFTITLEKLTDDENIVYIFMVQ